MQRSVPPGPGAILRDYRAEKLAEELRGNWAIALLYRLPGAVVAALALRRGWSATALTVAGAGVTLLLPLAALVLPLSVAIWGVVVLAVLFQVLDCADGDVARQSGSASPRGAQLDFLTDMAHWAFLYGAIGILADRFSGGGWGFTALALLAAWGRLYARVLSDSAGRFDAPPAPFTFGPIALIVAFFSGLSGLIGFLAFSTPFGLLPVAALLIYSLLDLGQAALHVRAAPPK